MSFVSKRLVAFRAPMRPFAVVHSPVADVALQMSAASKRHVALRASIRPLTLARMRASKPLTLFSDQRLSIILRNTELRLSVMRQILSRRKRSLAFWMRPIFFRVSFSMLNRNTLFNLLPSFLLGLCRAHRLRANVRIKMTLKCVTRVASSTMTKVRRLVEDSIVFRTK